MDTHLLMSNRAQELRQVLNYTAQNVNDITNEVQAWSEFLACLLKDLEIFAMANDPNHPEKYERMLQQLSMKIDTRLKDGQWRCLW